MTEAKKRRAFGQCRVSGVTETKKKKSFRSMQGVWNDRSKEKEELSVNAGCLE
ncbi:hypothetical protein MLOOGBEN_08335 [Bacillus sp. EB106-08-02-XG196]|jgi:hypothetical protein|uniref:hypothetical protein n=1 Tax=Bacillus sp. EB106-08-02-XG196 TaxID=2737049 RepID=UPI0015C41E18|nr:hypothetical protein [Bacillus sp. EB106-08-02-XG196]NWQ40706.1 hypothetical protein [Bacillus sp. EB106-08-02-XG196]